MLVTDALTADDARAYCGSHGGDLAAVSGDTNQVEFLHEQVVLSNHKGAYWVGLHDSTIQGRYWLLQHDS